MSDLDRLLDLQAADTTADQLRHRLATLPERAELVALDEREQSLRVAAEEPRSRRDELAREQRRLEDEIAGLEEKAGGANRRLYGESITSPKEAQDLQAELDALGRRQSELEDRVLELMEQAEPLDAELDASEAALAALDAARDDARSRLADAEADTSAQLAEVEGGRDALAAEVPAALLEEYERLRPQLGGVAVARLSGATCQGCHLTLAAAEVDQLRHQPPDALVHCPDCGRLLVR